MLDLKANNSWSALPPALSLGHTGEKANIATFFPRSPPVEVFIPLSLTSKCLAPNLCRSHPVTLKSKPYSLSPVNPPAFLPSSPAWTPAVDFHWLLYILFPAPLQSCQNGGAETQVHALIQLIYWVPTACPALCWGDSSKRDPNVPGPPGGYKPAGNSDTRGRIVLQRSTAREDGSLWNTQQNISQLKGPGSQLHGRDKPAEIESVRNNQEQRGGEQFIQKVKRAIRALKELRQRRIQCVL